jgi:hypothetical protein
MTHPYTCRCQLHAALQLRRDAAYRLLAQTILGPGAPTDTAELVEALRAHARHLRPEGSSLAQAA